MKRLPRELHRSCGIKTTSLGLARETMVSTPSQLWWGSTGNRVPGSHRCALQMVGCVSCAQCNKCYTRVFENSLYLNVTDNVDKVVVSQVISSYHPASNGLVERAVDIFKQGYGRNS